jgi:hypothetical protein
MGRGAERRPAGDRAGKEDAKLVAQSLDRGGAMWYSTPRCLTRKWAASQRVGEESGIAGTPADGRSPERTQGWSEAKGQEGKARRER